MNCFSQKQEVDIVLSTLIGKSKQFPSLLNPSSRLLSRRWAYSIQVPILQTTDELITHKLYK